MAMTPNEIYKALGEIRTAFLKSSKMFVGFYRTCRKDRRIGKLHATRQCDCDEERLAT